MSVPPQATPSPIDRRRRGMALVLVLAALALLSFLVVLVLTMTRNEDRAAKSSADIIEVRTLADLPAQIVISQIRRATSNLGTAYTWTSQPGMIRLFASGGTEEATGRAALYEAYRLYSSPRMVVLGSDFDATREQDFYKDWSSSTAVFTDLNEPMPLRPVVKAGGGSTAPASDKPRLVFPILDPGALGLIEGFELAGGAAPGAMEAHPLPMPAMWLYVLKDGRVISPSGGSGAKATFASGEATDKNPIVGRIAFWTDDESCKINLNTAGEPAPWDEPRANSKMDRAYTAYQPAQNEFHRQAGHPAFTALSPVFNSFGREDSTSTEVNAFSPVPDPAGVSSTGAFDPNNDPDAEKFRDYVESNLRPLPRTADHTDNTNQDRGSRHGTQPPSEKVKLKNERLFATIDELLFDTGRKPANVSGDGLTLAQTLNEDDIRRARFFLTTNSAAPETNPFNGPKISLWPVQEETDLRTQTDRVMVMAASLSGNLFFWQRESAWSSTDKPGSAQSTSADAGITRNLELMGYLQDLATLPVPGYGGSLQDKYGDGSNGAPSNTNQIITSMLDMLRWGVNIENADQKAGEVFHYLPPGRLTEGVSEPVGEYSAVPMILGGADNTQVRGFGRFPTITEVALVFVAMDAEKKDEKYVDEDGDRMADKTTKLRMFLILEPFCPVPGVPASTPAVRYRIRGLDQLKIENKPLFEAGYADTNRSVSTGPANQRVLEGATAFNGLVGQFLKPDGTPKQAGSNEDNDFPFLSAEITLPEAVKWKTDQINFSAAPITVDILSGFGAANDDAVIQTLRIPLPESCKISAPALNLENPTLGTERITGRFTLKDLRQPLIQNGDIVRSVEADPSLSWRGDLRLLALLGARGNPPVTFRDDPQAKEEPSRWVFPSQAELASRFATTDEARRALHSLRSGAYTDQQFGKALPDDSKQSTDETSGRFLAGFPYPASFSPAVVSMPRDSGGSFLGALNSNNRPGDWNNGPGLIEDGPYIARPDLGNTMNEAAAATLKTTGGWFQRGGDFQPDTEGMNSAPHRQIASAIAFGSLPTGVHPRGDDKYSHPWQTLLFCPNPASRQTEAGTVVKADDHFGFTSPPDHAWLEFFWMPVMEPYPMSPGFSTAGKVNLNTQILPYSYIQRTTAMHAALRGVRMTAIPSAVASSSAGDDFYKKPDHVTEHEFRYPVNATATLKGIDAERFQKGDVFRSASEICEMFLVPKRFGETDSGEATDEGKDHDYGGAKATAGLAHDKMIEWWNGQPGNAADAFEATGDNTREAPYAQLYPRLCTRSNVFQVHYRVQLLKKSRAVSPEEVDLARDMVTAEYRGSTTIERYLDPNDPEIPDLATQAGGTTALDDHYLYRIISRQPFTP